MSAARVALLLVLVPVLIASCMRPRPARVTHYHAAPIVALRVHADVDFTPLERNLIDQAVRDLEWQSAGWLTVHLDYDLSYSDYSVVEQGLLARTYAIAPLTLDVEARRKAHVYGYTYQGSRQSYLVSDRLDSPELWRHVTMHELLHMAGLDDIPDTEQDIMAGARRGKTPVTCLSAKDAREFCRALRCEWRELNYCGG